MPSPPAWDPLHLLPTAAVPLRQQQRRKRAAAVAWSRLRAVAAAWRRLPRQQGVERRAAGARCSPAAAPQALAAAEAAASTADWPPMAEAHQARKTY